MKLVSVILAGGKSSRMGEDKALMPWGREQSMLLHQASVLSQVVGADSVFVSGSRSGFDTIPDGKQGWGPVEGVRASLEYLSRIPGNVSVIFVPVDMPRLSSSEIGELVSSIGNSDAAIFEGTNLPVLIQKPDLVLRKIGQMDGSGSGSDYSLHNLYKRLEMAIVPGLRSENLINLNTPEEYNVAVSETRNPS